MVGVVRSVKQSTRYRRRMMPSAIQVRLDPTPRQERLLTAHAGAARFAYNCLLAHVKADMDARVKPEWSMYGLRKWWNTHKNTLAVSTDTGLPWWQEYSKEVYSYAAECLANGLHNWSESRQGKRLGRRVGFPQFKRKNKTRLAFAYTTGSFGLVAGKPHAVRLPKIGVVHCFENVSKRVKNARILRMSVNKRGNHWYASLTLDKQPVGNPAPCTQGSIGVDLGISEFATLSDGTIIPNPHPYRAAKRNIGRLQRRLSRQQRGSARYERNKQRLNTLYARTRHMRLDMQHKLSTYLVRTYQTIGIEDLHVQGMVKNRRLAQAIEDAAFYQFRTLLTYKSIASNTNLVIANRFYPSSKTCSQCGQVKTKLALTERTYKCEHCGLELDRDVNAAINLAYLAESASESLNARGADIRPVSNVSYRQSAKKREPSSKNLCVRLGADRGNAVM